MPPFGSYHNLRKLWYLASKQRHSKFYIFDIAIFNFQKAIFRQSKVQISRFFCQNHIRRDRFLGVYVKIFFALSMSLTQRMGQKSDEVSLTPQRITNRLF